MSFVGICNKVNRRPFNLLKLHVGDVIHSLLNGADFQGISIFVPPPKTLGRPTHSFARSYPFMIEIRTERVNQFYQISNDDCQQKKRKLMGYNFLDKYHGEPIGENAVFKHKMYIHQEGYLMMLNFDVLFSSISKCFSNSFYIERTIHIIFTDNFEIRKTTTRSFILY